MKRIEGKDQIWRSTFRYQTPRTLWHKFWREITFYGLLILVIAGSSLWVIQQGY